MNPDLPKKMNPDSAKNVNPDSQHCYIFALLPIANHWSYCSSSIHIHFKIIKFLLLLQLFIRAKGAPALLGFFYEKYDTIEDYNDDDNGKNWLKNSICNIRE